MSPVLRIRRARLVAPLAPALLLTAAARAGITFQLTFDDPASTYASYYSQISSNFLAAGADWAQYLPGNASLQVVVRFTTDVPRSSAPSVTTHQVGTSGALTVYEQGAAAEIRTGADPNGSDYDLQLLLNPTYLTTNLWFDPNPTQRTAPVPIDRTDAVSVFIHELAHGLAFNGWRDSTNSSLPGNYESTFDKLVSFDNTNFFFTGPYAAAYYGSSVPLTFGNIFHIGNNAPRPGSDLIPDLMNGVVFFLGTRYDISLLDLFMTADTGLPVTNIPAAWNGSNGNWSAASSWSTRAFIPGNTYPNLQFAASIPFGIVSLDVSPTIQSLALTGGTLTGTGNLTLLSGGTVTGFYQLTGTTTISAGTLVFSAPAASAGPITGPGNLLVSAGSTLTSSALSLTGSWTIIGTHIIRPGLGNAGTIRLSAFPTLATLTTGSSSTYTATLDLTDNKFILETTSPADKSAKLAQLLPALHSGSNAGTWTGKGLTSSTAAQNPQHYALALFDNATLGLIAFGGKPADANSLLISIAHLGDANDNGIIDIQDQSIVTNHWQSPQQTWSSGDLNLDGIVDLQDLTLVTNNWQQSTTNSQLPFTNYQLPSIPIPEPSSLALLLLSAPLLAMWHSRRGGARLCRQRPRA